jgi:uncharacterized Zn finger protein (UPF0148 family)
MKRCQTCNWPLDKDETHCPICKMPVDIEKDEDKDLQSSETIV